MILVLGVWTFLRALLGRSTAVTLENVALRHQLEVLRRATPRLRLRRRARIFWVCLSRLWTNWRASLVLARPATVVSWHRQGFQLYWRWKSRPRLPGRPFHLLFGFLVLRHDRRELVHVNVTESTSPATPPPPGQPTS